MNRPLALIPFALLAALVAAGALWHLGDLRAHNTVESVPTGETVTLGGPFALTDQNGIVRTEKDYGGEYTLAVFCSNQCSDGFPTTPAVAFSAPHKRRVRADPSASRLFT